MRSLHTTAGGWPLLAATTEKPAQQGRPGTYIISQCPEPWRSWNTSVAQARFIKKPGYRPAVKIEAAYLLHFVQINLKTCESYSLERLGEEVNNIRLILTSRGGERTKIQKVSRSRNSGSCSSTLPRWELGATLSCHFAPLARCWLWRPFRAGGFALCPGFLGCMGHISPCSVGLCCLPDAPLLSCFLTAAAEIRFNYGLS